MRETSFKRAAKVSLSISKSDANALRDTLVRSIKPMVEYLASELVQLAMRRLSGEVDRMGEAFEVAISAYASASEPAVTRKGQTSDTPARVVVAESKSAGAAPVPEADYSRSGAPRASGNGDFVRGAVRSQTTDAAVPEPAVAAEQGSTSSPSASKVTCSKCGHVGGNARGCGKPTGHPTQTFARALEAAIDGTIEAARKAYPDGYPPGPRATSLPKRATGSTTFAVPPPPVRALKPTAAAIEQHRNRLAVLRECSAAQPADKPIARAGEDDNPNAKERWTKEEIEDETAEAHARKLSGELPGPLSTWTFG